MHPPQNHLINIIYSGEVILDSNTETGELDSSLSHKVRPKSDKQDLSRKRLLLLDKSIQFLTGENVNGKENSPPPSKAKETEDVEENFGHSSSNTTKTTKNIHSRMGSQNWFAAVVPG